MHGDFPPIVVALDGDSQGLAPNSSIIAEVCDVCQGRPARR
jgi:hypothetical protein